MPPKFPKGVLEELAEREVFCGFSGGADSLALLLLLKTNDSLFTLKAVHFEHGIRGDESLSDAIFCERVCAKLNVPFEKIALAVPRNTLPGEGVEAAARRLRMTHWKRLASSDKQAIALGHNANDRAENLLLRLFRGSNATGLSSMRPTQKINGALFVRPLLETSREQIETFLRESGADTWRTDSTNSDEHYKRNLLRHSIIPAIAKGFPYAFDGIAHSLKALQDDASYLEAQAADKYIATQGKLTATEWLATPPALRIRVLRLWLSEKLNSDFIPDSKLMERFTESLENAGTEAALIPLKDSCGFLSVSKATVSLVPEQLPDIEWNWQRTPECRWGNFILKVSPDCTALPKDNWSAIFNAPTLPHTLVVGRWREGERMTIMGRKSPEKLKELFNKSGIASLARESQPVLRLPTGEAIWLPGLRRSDFAPVDGNFTNGVWLLCRLA